MEANKIQVIDDQGNEKEFEVLFTFDGENGNKYVLYLDDDGENVFASGFDDEGNLYPIESPEEWEMVEEVFQAFMSEDQSDDDETEEHTCCGNHGEGCCHEEEEHTCCGGNGDCGCNN